jgi:hypothetical protein
MKSGRKCSGYTQDATNAQLVTLETYNPRASPTSKVSELGENAIYLDFYHRCAASSIASNFDRDFWSGIVLQLTQSEPAVRHAVAALGFLVKTEPGSLKHARSFSAMENRKTLLFQYNKAVRSLVARMSEPSYTVEIGLVTCLLFICVEYLRGDYPAAFMHLHSGLKVIAQIGPSSPTSLASRVADPELIMSKIAPIFTRAITTGLLIGAPFEPLLDGHCPRPQAFLGHSFRSVMEAQIVLFALRNATVILMSVLYRKLAVCFPLDPDDLQYRLHLLNCHDQWLRGLQNLENECDMSKEDVAVFSSLKVSHYCTYVALAGALDFEQTIYDAHVEDVKALNHHARIVLDSMGLYTPTSSGPKATRTDRICASNGEQAVKSSSNILKKPAAHFTFDISLIAPLVSITTKSFGKQRRSDSANPLHGCVEHISGYLGID